MEENNKNKDYEFVLLERLENKVDAITEGQNILKEELSGKVDSLAKKVDLLTEDVDFVKGEVVEIRKRFKEVDEDLAKKADKAITDNHENRIIKLENTALAEA